MSETIHTLIPEEEVEKRICEIAAQISKDYEGKSVHLICILKGSVMFMSELAKRITVPVTMDFMSFIQEFSCHQHLSILAVHIFYGVVIQRNHIR